MGQPRSKRVELLDQIDKNATRSGLGEDVGEHHSAGDVLDRHHFARDEVAEELGSAQNVLGLLEGDGAPMTKNEERPSAKREDAISNT